MVKVANSALEYLRRASVGIVEPPNACLRMKIGLKGPQFKLDEARPDDVVVDDDGKPLLAVDAATAEQTAGQTLVYDEDRLQLALAG